MMKISLNRMRIMTLVAMGCLLFLPAFAAADVCTKSGIHCETLDPVVFGPGVHEAVAIPLGVQAGLPSTQNGGSTLKKLIISVQNGTQRGKDKASSAVINVNGEDIFTQKNFNQNVSPSSLTKTVDVEDPSMREVVLTTRVNGRKEVRLAVTITAVYEDAFPVPWCLDTDGDGIGDSFFTFGVAPPDSDPGWTTNCGNFP